MRTSIHIMLTAIALGAPAAYAQQTPPPKGDPVVTSSPGKAKAESGVRVTATVESVDKATRRITLKGPKGKTIDVVASDEVKNFDQIQVGDRLIVEYREALSLELRKTKAKDTSGVVESGVAAKAAPGERPAAAAGREVTAVAEVVAVDPQKSIISLKGPQGNVVDLKVKNKDHFKVVKKGDQVDVTYTEAVAIAVRPAPKPAAK